MLEVQWDQKQDLRSRTALVFLPTLTTGPDGPDVSGTFAVCTFAEAGASTLPELETFQRTSNSLRRILQTLGLKRRARDVTMTLQEYWNHDDEAEVQP